MCHKIQRNNIKTLVTLEDKIDIERKGQQSVQGTLYVRFACFGNGSLHALYDKSNGFYRRQLLLTTKEKPVGRVDNPFLIDKMRNEKEGILLWALEGLHRLIRNNYQFTISERTAANLKEAMEQGNNILGFLKSESYFEIRQGPSANPRISIKSMNAGVWTIWKSRWQHQPLSTI